MITLRAKLPVKQRLN